MRAHLIDYKFHWTLANQLSLLHIFFVLGYFFPAFNYSSSAVYDVKNINTETFTP